MHETRIWVWSWGSFSFLKCSAPKEDFSRSGCLHEKLHVFFQIDLWKTSETQRFLFWPTIKNSMTEPVPQNPSCVINCLFIFFVQCFFGLNSKTKPKSIFQTKLDSHCLRCFSVVERTQTWHFRQCDIHWNYQCTQYICKLHESGMHTFHGQSSTINDIHPVSWSWHGVFGLSLGARDRRNHRQIGQVEYSRM